MNTEIKPGSELYRLFMAHVNAVHGDDESDPQTTHDSLIQALLALGLMTPPATDHEYYGALDQFTADQHYHGFYVYEQIKDQSLPPSDCRYVFYAV